MDKIETYDLNGLEHIKSKLTTVCAGAVLVFSALPAQGENLSVVVSTGSPIFANALLDKTANGFLGRPSINADFGVKSNKFAFAGSALSLRWTNRRAVTARWSRVSTVSAGYFRYRQLQPDGISIFVDPAKIKVRSVFLEAQTGVEFAQGVTANTAARFAASVGVQASYSDISITSAVLNVQNELTALNPFSEFKASVDFSTKVPFEAFVSIRAAPRGYQELGIGVSAQF